MDQLFAPQNLIFYIAIIFGLLMLIGSAMGIGGGRGAHAPEEHGPHANREQAAEALKELRTLGGKITSEHE